MWRLDTYWRMEEKDGGVYIQNESVELSRTVPPILAWFVNPFIKSILRNVLVGLLSNTRNQILKTNTFPKPPDSLDAVWRGVTKTYKTRPVLPYR